MRTVVFLPGFNGSARQPLLTRMAAELRCRCLFPGLPGGRPSAQFEREVEHVARAVKWVANPVLVGRSFGGRVALRYALRYGAKAVVLLAFPVRPAGQRRPDDEAALREISRPVLIIQGTHDEKGPLEVLRPLVERNPALRLELVDSGHSFGKEEPRVIELASEFLREQTASGKRGRVLVRSTS